MGISKLRANFEQLAFKLKIFNMQAEMAIPLQQFMVYVSINMLVICEGICMRVNVFSALGFTLNKYHLYVLFICGGLTFVFSYIITTALFLSNQTKIHEKLPRFIEFSAQSKPFYERIIFPLLVWSFVYSIFQKDYLAAVFSVGVPSVIVGVFFIFINHMFFQGTIPNTALKAILNPQYHNFYALSVNIILALGVVAKNLPESTVRTMIYVAIACISGFLVGFCIMRPPFWLSLTNRLYLTFNLVLFMICLWNLIFTYSRQPELHWGALFLALGFAIKLGAIIPPLQDHIEIFDKHTSYYSRLRGMNLLTALLSKSWVEPLSTTESIMLENFKRQMRERGAKLGKNEEVVELATKSCGKLAAFLAEYGEEFNKSIDMSKFELLARLMSPSDNILKAFLSLQKYKRLLGSGITARLEIKFFELLFEARLRAFYYLRPEEKASQETIVSQLFNNYIINAEQNINTKVADICLPLNHKSLFLGMMDCMKSTVSKRLDIYNYIVAKSNTTSSLMSIDLFHGNLTASETVANVKKFIATEIDVVKMPPSYYYPPQFVLQALIYHDTIKARRTLRNFKKSLQQWDVIKAREQSLRLDLLDVHSAVLQVSLQQHDRGRIVDATPNWSEMLGSFPDGGSIINHNVNDMFIDILSKKHAIMMNNSFGFTRILNNKRDFYIKAFTGELKAVIFTLRLWPSLEKDLTGVVAIGPSTTQRQGQNMVLLTQDMDIIQAEEEFWSNVGMGDNNEDMTNILQLTKRLMIVNSLLDLFEGFLTDMDKFDVEHEPDTPLEAIYKIGKVIRKLNDSCSLVYRVDNGTPFTHHLRGTPLMCKLNIVRFMDVTLSQLFIRFGIKEVEKNKNGILFKKQTTLAASYSEFDKNLMMSKNMEPNNETIDDTGDKMYFAMNTMTLKDKLKVWNEEEKPTDVDMLLNELFTWVGRADEQDVRLCPFILKKYLIELGDVLKVYKGSVDDKRSIGDITEISKPSMVTRVSPQEEFIESPTQLEKDMTLKLPTATSGGLKHKRKSAIKDEVGPDYKITASSGIGSSARGVKQVFDSSPSFNGMVMQSKEGIFDIDGIEEPSGIKRQLEEDQGISINFNNTLKFKDSSHFRKPTHVLEGRRANFSMMSGSKSTKRKKVSSV